ncbi:MAG: DUF4252 domain-containing protein [Acidobacteriota bacterium]
MISFSPKATFFSALLIGLSFCLGNEVRGQGAKLPLEHLEQLSAKAAESVDVSLDSQMLQVAAKFLRSDKPDEAAIKQLIQGLKGVYVRVLHFDKPGEYATADVDALRNQLRGPGWSKIVGVRSKRDGEAVEVFTWVEGGSISGLAIIAAEPSELVIVNIIGPIDIEKLSQLEGKFGIPQLNLEKVPRPRKE